eukprot:TRINITY_DN8083_c0_g1_i1.p1 TRINITY_DN8083_c0_g1~~TRINITY_DN8083_c0_g1_i1.p1  ORF type:complete len:50 (-),score=16.07 TRINITY_DN8083_c0_g1_i1:259-408(-)
MSSSMSGDGDVVAMETESTSSGIANNVIMQNAPQQQDDAQCGHWDGIHR